MVTWQNIGWGHSFHGRRRMRPERKQSLTLFEILEDIDNSLTNSLSYKDPDMLIESSYKEFFRRCGRYEFQMRDEPALNVQANEDFQKALLKRFLNYNIGYTVEGTFYLNLGSYLQRKMPVYSRIWGDMLDNIMADQVSMGQNNMSTITSGNSEVTSLSQHHLATHQQAETMTSGTSESTSTGDTNTTALAGMLDTPQNVLDMDLQNLEYATNISKTETDVNSTTNTQGEQTGNSVTQNDTTVNSDDESDTKTTNNSQSASAGGSQSQGRSTNALGIYQNWVNSGFDMYSPVFDGISDEQIFLTIFN